LDGLKVEDTIGEDWRRGNARVGERDLPEEHTVRTTSRGNIGRLGGACGSRRQFGCVDILCIIREGHLNPLQFSLPQRPASLRGDGDKYRELALSEFGLTRKKRAVVEEMGAGWLKKGCGPFRPKIVGTRTAASARQQRIGGMRSRLSQRRRRIPPMISQTARARARTAMPMATGLTGMMRAPHMGRLDGRYTLWQSVHR
jgi:hypothetical protein